MFSIAQERLIGDFQSDWCEWLSHCVSSAIDCQPVEDVPHLSPCDSCNHPHNPELDRCKKMNGWNYYQWRQSIKIHFTDIKGMIQASLFIFLFHVSQVDIHSLRVKLCSCIILSQTSSDATLSKTYWMTLHSTGFTVGKWTSSKMAPGLKKTTK